VGASKLEELRLLVSELVTDRVRSLPAGRGIMLDLRAGETVRCAVVDDGPAGLPTVWGVAFLDRFADAWGVTPAHNRACIWFVASKHEIDR
jgi:hypothetical protein